jgi:outer membrane protein OmpA-like peptidoglycan-associated protein
MTHRSSQTPALLAAAAACLVAPRAAHADDWLSAELPAAVAMSSPQNDYFRAGAMPAVGGYVSVGDHVALGLRMRFGALGNASDHGPNMKDPGAGGLVSGALALRFTAASTWIEIDAGGGMTGSDTAPTFEVGIGRTFVAGPVVVGPMVRYLRVIDTTGNMLGQGDAAIVLAGFELQVGRDRPRVRPMIEADDAPAAPMVAERDADQMTELDRSCMVSEDPNISGCAAHDRDHDGIPDDVDQCPDEPEVINGVDDQDGCPDQGGLFEVTDDRIVLEERVLFDVNRARIKRSGRPVIAAIAASWNEHPDWGRMKVEGHADVRGPDPFNAWLSSTRAARVREALVAAGVPPERIESYGFGATRPRDPGMTEEAHARNRRVEFVIVPLRRPL